MASRRKRCRRTSSGWLGTFFPGETLPLGEPRLTGFETLNPLLGRAFSGDSTKQNALCRRSGARLPGELLPLDEPRLTGFEALNPLLGRALSGDSTKQNALCRRSGARLPGEALPLDEPRLTGFETLNPLLGRTPDDSTERRIVHPRGAGLPSAQRVASRRKRCRRTSSD